MHTRHECTLILSGFREMNVHSYFGIYNNGISVSMLLYCKEYLYIRNIFIPTLPSLWRMLLLYLIKFGFTSRYSLSVKSCSDFLKICFFMLCCVTLFICLYSCPIQHVPAESARSAGEIRRLELVFTDYTLSIIAQCWPEVQRVVPWRVRLLDCIDLFLYQLTICPIQRRSMKSSVTPNAEWCPPHYAKHCLLLSCYCSRYYY